MSDDSDVHNNEAACEQAIWDAIDECKHLNPPYHASVWIGMVRQGGAANAARHLLINGDIQEGFRRLVDAGRPNLTVEWSALNSRWSASFEHRTEKPPCGASVRPASRICLTADHLGVN